MKTPIMNQSHTLEVKKYLPQIQRLVDTIQNNGFMVRSFEVYRDCVILECDGMDRGYIVYESYWLLAPTWDNCVCSVNSYKEARKQTDEARAYD